MVPTLLAIAVAMAVVAALSFRIGNEFWVLRLAAADPSDIVFGDEIIEDRSELNRLIAVSAKTTKSPVLPTGREGGHLFIPEASEQTIIRAQLPP